MTRLKKIVPLFLFAVVSLSASAQHGAGGVEASSKNDSPFATIITAVVMLGLIFFAMWKWGKKKPSSETEKTEVVSANTAADIQKGIPGEVLAAISTALYELNEEQHDNESTVLTIKSRNQQYSPWGAKSQLIRHLPHK